MEYISLLKNRKSAMEDTAKSSKIAQQQRVRLQNSLKLMRYTSYAAKGLILTGAVFLVDWKKKVSFTKRQIPLTIGALLLTALSDFGISQFTWQKHQKIVVQYTGFKNGVYMNPQKLQRMKDIYSKGLNVEQKIQGGEEYFEQDLK